MKKLLMSLFALGIFATVFSSFTYAHPGNTASDGCHYCRTNCDKRGVAWNQRHCHGGSSYTTQKTTTTTYKSCSSLYGYGATSDGNGGCKCSYGYGYYNGKCTSLNTICQNIYGWSASYDSLNKSCKCNYGYAIYNGTCTSLNSICSKKFGYSYYYDSFEKACVTY